MRLNRPSLTLTFLEVKNIDLAKGIILKEFKKLKPDEKNSYKISVDKEIKKGNPIIAITNARVGSGLN